MMSPEKFVKPADLFKMRRKSKIEEQSPMKCLNNLTDPSPTKKLPTLLRNPFNQPVKRKLQLGGSGCSSSPNKNNINIKKRLHASPRKSPIKKIRMFQMDEDANLEPPKMKQSVYQHPYFSWMTLYPRRKISDFERNGKTAFFKVTKCQQAIDTIHNDWCESIDDLTSLLVNGKCPFFYVCSDHYSIQFRNHQNKIQASISPISFGMNCELKKANISVDTNEDSGIENDTSLDKDLGIEDTGEDENSDASQFLESLGWSQQELVSEFQARKNPVKEDQTSQSLSRSLSNKSSASIEGADDVKKLVKFLKSNKTYTISTVGQFAHIPPTLLAPAKFHLSTLGRLVVDEPGFVD